VKKDAVASAASRMDIDLTSAGMESPFEIDALPRVKAVIVENLIIDVGVV